jgi:hypothetical protein
MDDQATIFPATELKPFAEPISADEMQQGRIYFALQFLDEHMLIPVLEPLVFLGYDLRHEGNGSRYFQDFESFRADVRFSTVSTENRDHFQVYARNEGNHIFEFEDALKGLMRCALRRREPLSDQIG